MTQFKPDPSTTSRGMRERQEQHEGLRARPITLTLEEICELRHGGCIVRDGVAVYYD